MSGISSGFVHIGPEWHGVTRFGRLLQAAAPEPTATVEMGCNPARALDLVSHQRGRAAAWFLQFTDHLFGDHPADAATVVVDLVRRLAPARLVVTLHDLPGDDSPPARCAAYLQVATAASVVVVCSTHERARLRRCGYRGRVDVVPHFVEARPTTRIERRPRSTPTVGVLGFLFPGKGHLSVLRACARCRREVEMVALGGPSPGHAHLVDQLLAESRRLGVACTITGWIPETDLDHRLAAIDVPVTAHEAISASSSIATWIAAGRRPIVPAGDYVDELLTAAPGTVAPYDAGDRCALPDSIDAAVVDPSSTRQVADLGGLSVPMIVSRYLGLVR